MKLFIFVFISLLNLSLFADVNISDIEDNVNLTGQALGDDADYFAFEVHHDGQLSILINNNNSNKLQNSLISSSCSTPSSGDILLIGNTNVCALNDDNECYDPKSTDNGSLKIGNADADKNPATFNSSSAKLKIPDGAKILWATLYWQGHYADGSNTQKESSRYIKIKHENDTGYKELIADETNWVYRYKNGYWYIDWDLFQYAWAWTTPTPISFHYQSQVDITDYLKSYPNGNIWVADLQSELGSPGWGGSYGAWSIALVYQDKKGEIRNLSVFDGFLGMNGDGKPWNENGFFDVGCSNYGLNDSTNIPLSGFLTPASGDINSKFFVFAGEGVLNVYGDALKLKDSNGIFQDVEDAINPAGNQFNSSITKDGIHLSDKTDPEIFAHYLNNSLGIDIDTYDVSSIIGNSQTSTEVRLGSTGDWYYPDFFAFATDLYKPLVCYTENILVNGVAYDGSSAVSIGSVITMEVNVTNQGVANALGVSVQNIVQDEFTYNPETLRIDDILAPSGFIPQTDAIADDEAEYNSSIKKMTFYLGTDANGSGTGTGGVIKQNQATRFDYNVTLSKGNDQNSTTNIYYVSYTDNDLGITFSGVPMPECTDSAKGINFGAFTPIANSIDALDDPNVNGVIKTKVVNKAFEIYAVNIVDGVKKPWSSNFPLPVLMYLNEDDCSIEKNSDNPFAIAFIQKGDSSARAYDIFNKNSNPLFSKAKRTARIITSYFDFGALFSGDTTINCTQHSSITKGSKGSTGKPHTGVPACLISNNPTDNSNIVEEFPNAAECYASKGPCRASSKITDFLGTVYANEYGCLICITKSDPNLGCSSDNFSIRPDHFVLDLATLSPADPPNLLRAAQAYDIDAFAYGYNTTEPALGYNQADANLSAFANTRLPSGVIDTNLSGTTYINKGIFVDGRATNTPINFSFSDVGKITFDLNDTNWAAVDADDTPLSDYIIHGDIDLTFIPWDFNITAATLLNNNNGAVPFTYFSDDLNMSAKIPLTLIAQNKQGKVTKNYANNLYEKKITISVALNSSKGVNFISSEIKNKDLDFILGKAVIKATDDNILRFNFDRASNTPLNPMLIRGSNINITAVDTNNVTSTQKEDANGSISFYYGRVHAPRTRISGATGDASLYYEIYCFGTDITNNECNTTLRDNLSGALLSLDDIRWFQNTKHTPNDSNTSRTFERNTLLNVSEGPYIQGATTIVPYTYNQSKGYPYKTTINIITSPWLLYNKFAPDPVQFNSFELEFNKASSEWIGEDKSQVGVDSNASINTNRRIQW